ncbi:MAG: TVP38/TMEM64 family protein [Beijerinckiaceae bacterium]
MDQPAPRFSLKRWLPLAVLAALAAVVFLTGAHRALSLEAFLTHKATLESHVRDNLLPALLAYMAVYIAVVALSLPGALIMTVIGGILFKFWLGLAATVIAATIGATLVFLIARSSLGEALRARAGDGVQRMAARLKQDAASYLLFLRLVPIFPFALVNLAPAIVGVPLATYVWTTFVGILPGSAAFTLAATGLDGVLAEQGAMLAACRAAGKADCRATLDFSTLVSPHLLVAFAALGAVALIPVVARRFLAKPGQ